MLCYVLCRFLYYVMSCHVSFVTCHVSCQVSSCCVMYHVTSVVMSCHFMCAWGELGAQKGLACYPDSVDTLISLMQPNLAEIWACECKHIACMHVSLHDWVKFCAQRS